MKHLGVIVAVLGIAVTAVLMQQLGGVAKIPAMFDADLPLDTATKLSADSGKPVLALVTADWCGPCQKLKRSTLSDPEVERLVRERMIAVYIDADNNRGEAVELGNIRSLPTTVIRLGEEEVSRQVGLIPKDEYIAWLRTSLEEVSRRTAMTADE